jgi:hypothetical protein
MWYERFVIIVPSLAHSYEPWKFLNYHMSFTEAAILMGSFGWFFMWFLLFLRLPAVALDRRDQGDPAAADEASSSRRSPRWRGSSRSCRPATRSERGAADRIQGMGVPMKAHHDGRAGRLRPPRYRERRDRAAAAEGLSADGLLADAAARAGGGAGGAGERGPHLHADGRLHRQRGGAALAVWASLDWPLIVGGKEIVALPAFSVIIFELTILLGALSTVAGLFLTGRLPRIGKPEALYHPSFSGTASACSRTSAGGLRHGSRDHERSGSEEVLLDPDAPP